MYHILLVEKWTIGLDCRLGTNN